MKILQTLVFTCLIAVFFETETYGISQIIPGPDTIRTNTLISSSCIINGNLVLINGSTLNVDLSNAASDTFVVRGNIVLMGNAVLWVHAASVSADAQFIVSNPVTNQRSITTLDSSRVQLENIEFRTQEGNLTGASCFYMNYNARNKSILYVDNCFLNNQTAWLLCNLKNSSTLIEYVSKNVPCETYLQDSAEAAYHGAATSAGLWLDFQTNGQTLNLPSNQAVPYSWKIGRGQGGITTPWYLEIDTANPGIGVQIFPTAKLTVNGTGLPATGELKVALNYSNNTDTVRNLSVGLQNTILNNGPGGGVTLNNVNLGPIAWQVYALIDENLTIKNCTVNEIGIGGPSTVTVDSSVLQLALLAAVGQDGSSLTVNNSQIWNQFITAANKSRLTLNNCSVTGSHFYTSDTASRIVVNGGCFFSNPSGCTESNMVNSSTGIPNCNPFIPAGYPQNLTPATVTFSGVSSSCPTGIEQVINTAWQIKVYPNPGSGKFTIQMEDGQLKNYSEVSQNPILEIYNTMGERIFSEMAVASSTNEVDLSPQPSGIYFLRIDFVNGSAVSKIFLQK